MNVLLAPNGKPSNLTPEQYKLVRTPSFKEWFGDWENSPETASKVVDENGEPLVVYHGYLVGGGAGRKFYEFKKLPAFFSKTKEFAYNYASTKSMDGGIDADIDTYACFLNVKKLFDSKNKENIKLAEEQLPEKIEVSHGTAWFLSAYMPKEEVIEQMKGIITISTDDLSEDILSSNVGDIIAEKVSESQYENKILLNKDEDWGYITDAKNFDEVVQSEIAEWVNNDYEKTIKYKGKYLKTFIINEDTYKLQLNKDPLFLEFQNEVKKRKKYYFDNILNLLKDNGERIKAKNGNAYRDYFYVRKINLKTYKTTTKNNWTMFENETLQKFLIHNNFGGWVALEKGDKTYGVYDNKNIKLADGTNTTFDGNNPDIRYAGGGMLQKNKNRILSYLSNYKSYDEWKSENKSDYIYSQKNNLLKEIKEYYGIEYKGSTKYTFDDVLQDAKKYDSYSDWASKSRAKYDYSRINGWLVEIKKQFNYSPKAVKYTLESIIEKVKQYDSFQEWRENNASEYQTAKIKGWLPEIKNSIGYDKTNIQQIDKVKLILDVIIDSTKNYDSYSEWRLKNDSKYKKAIEQGWLEQIKELFNYEKRGRKDTLESIIEKVKQYPSYTEWMKDDVLTYQLALKRGYLSEIKNAIGYEESKYTLQSVIETAKEFGSFQQWRENNINQYNASHRNGWLNEIKDAIGYKTKKSQKKTELDSIIENAKKYKSYLEWIENNPNEFQDGGDVWDVDRYRQVEKEMYDLQQQGKKDSAEYFKLIKERSILEKNKSEENMSKNSIETFAKGGKILVKQINNDDNVVTVHKDYEKFARIGITDKYFIEASNDLGLQGVVFKKEELLKKINSSFNLLLATYENYLINKDSNSITFTIENRISTLEEEGASLELIEKERSKITDNNERQKIIDEFANVQRQAIKQWVDYLGQSDYPVQFKYLMLKAVLNYNYDLKLNRLFERTNETTRNITPFDAGTLADLFYANSNYLLLDYTNIMNENSARILNSKETIDETSNGKWIKFNGGYKTTQADIDKNGKDLMQLVQNTYWCTKSAGTSQLQGGDFYVYVTENLGEVTPQIAVRMNESKVGEVRGNKSSAQDLDEEMLPIAEKFLLNNIPNDSGKKWLDSIKYNKKCVEMRKRFESEGMYKDFIYDYVKLIGDKEKYKVDYGSNGNVTLLEKKFEEIIEIPNEYYKKGDIVSSFRFITPNTLYYMGSLTNYELNYLNQIMSINDMFNWKLKLVAHSLECSQQMLNLGNIEYVGHNLSLTSNITDLGNVKYVGNELSLNDNIKSLANLENMGGGLILPISLKDLGKLKKIGFLEINSCDENFTLGSLEEIEGNLEILNHSVDIDLGNLKTIGGSFVAINSIVTDLKNLESIGGDFLIRGSKIKKFENLKTIGGSADFSNNFAPSTQNIESILGDIKFLNSRIMEFPKLNKIGGNIEFRGSYFKSFGNIKTIGGDLDLKESKIEDLGNLEEVNGFASFEGSKVKTLNKLRKIVKFANFRNSDVDDLGNLESIGGNAYFNNTKIQSIGKLRYIGGFTQFDGNPSLGKQWEMIKNAE